MPLEGDLREFGVPEVLQFIEHQDRTGCLLLSIGTNPLEVYFEKGRIVGVLPAGQLPSEHLLDTLETLGILTKEEGAKIRELCRKDLRGLREILQQQKIMKPREIEFLLKERIKEEIFPVFASRRGRFQFDPESTLSTEWALSEPMPVEPIILEGLRRMDEWPILKRKIGSFSTVPRRRFIPVTTGRPSWRQRLRGIFWFKPLSLPEMLPDQELFTRQPDDLSSVDTLVYDLIDGKRTVEEIIWASSLGEYDCCKALLDLREGGWIQIDPMEAERVGAAVPVVGRLGLGRWVLTAGVLMAVFLCVSLFSRSVDITWVRTPTAEWTQSVWRLLNEYQLARVTHAVELYRKENGRVPAGLQDLVDVHLLREDDLSLWGNHAYSYTGDPPDTFRLAIVPVP